MSTLGPGAAEPVRIMASDMPYSFTPVIYIICKKGKRKRKRKKSREKERKEKVKNSKRYKEYPGISHTKIKLAAASIGILLYTFLASS